MPDLVIDRVNTLAGDQPSQLSLTDRLGRLIGDNDDLVTTGSETAADIPGADMDMDLGQEIGVTDLVETPGVGVDHVELPGVDTDTEPEIQPEIDDLDIQTLDSQLLEEEIGTIAPMQPTQGTVDHFV
jgi:hypothetical protein